MDNLLIVVVIELEKLDKSGDHKKDYSIVAVIETGKEVWQKAIGPFDIMRFLGICLPNLGSTIQQ